MLWNPKWPTPKTKGKWRVTLLHAADYIEQVGWCQNEEEDGQGRVCMVGAIYKVNPRHGHHAVTKVQDKLRMPIADFNDEIGVSGSHAARVLRQIALDITPAEYEAIWNGSVGTGEE